MKYKVMTGYMLTKDGKYIKSSKLKNKVYAILNKTNQRSHVPQIYSLKAVHNKLRTRFGIRIEQEALRHFMENGLFLGIFNKYRKKFLSKVTEGIQVKYYLEDRYAQKV